MYSRRSFYYWLQICLKHEMLILLCVTGEQELAAYGCIIKQRAECLSHSVMQARKDLGILPILPYKIGNCSWSHPGEV